MARVSPDDTQVNARIVYWGVAGAGKTANLQSAHSKLRPDHRGELREVATRLDPTVHYEVLPIELGEIAGVRTQIELIAVPGSAEQAPTRKQLLDQVDGIVLVIDSRIDQVDANLQSFDELGRALAAYGQSISELPIVVQYNKRDLADAYAVEELHRKLEIVDAAIFEAIATDGTGVLETLSTISKQVIRSLREHGAAAPKPPESPAVQPTAAPTADLEEAILHESDDPEGEAIERASREAEALLDRPWEDVAGEIERSAGVRLGPDVSILSVGEATQAGERALRVPVVLGDSEGGTSTLVLTIQLDLLLEETPE